MHEVLIGIGQFRMGGTGGGVDGWYRWWGGCVVQVVGWMGGTGGGVEWISLFTFVLSTCIH